MTPLYLCLIGILFGAGLWLLYRGRILLVPLWDHVESRRSRLLVMAALIGISVVLPGMGCRLTIAYLGG